MGQTRKTPSTFTLGAIDFRSDKEPTAQDMKQTRKAVTW